MGKGDPKGGRPTTPKATLAARGSWRAKLKDGPPKPAKDKPAALVVIPRDTSRFWGVEAAERRALAKLGPRDLGVPPWALELFEMLPGYDPVATAAPGEWFCEEIARDSIDFFPSELQLIEGEHANKPFNLQLWQQAITACLFGWLREDGTRRYREALIYVGRKNGKTPWAAGLVNLMMFQDHEPGSQLYSAAADLPQATLIYRHTAGMILRNPEMSSRARIYRTFKSIEYAEEGAIYKALTADADTKHGLGAHMVVVDELHAHRDGELVDVLLTSTAARREPLVLYITTADFARESVCNRKYDYGCKVRDGVVRDSSFLPVIYEAQLDDDIADPATWKKANPNMGVSVGLDYLARGAERAKNEPTYLNTFMRLHLNIRTQQDVKWLPLETWNKCNGAVDPDALRGRTCYAGLDLSSKLDLTAYALVFPPTEEDPMWRLLVRFFIPAETAQVKEKKDRVPYLTWAAQGLLTMTEGNVVDYDVVAASLLEDARTFDIQEVAFDPWNATHLALQLAESGANMIEFQQGFRSMSEPTKELEKLVVAGRIAHGGNEMLAWMVSHVAVELDAAGNVKLSKRKSTQRIDGLICIVMGLGRGLIGESNVYSESSVTLW